MNKQIYKEFNLIDDQKFALKLNLWGFVLLVFFLIVSWLIEGLLPQKALRLAGIWDMIFTLLAFFLVIILHETIHGLFFKLLSPEAHVKFGFKNGMAYATSPGTLYSKPRYFVIAIMPFVLITTLGVISCLIFGYYYWLQLLLVVHAAACIGDFYWCYLLLKAPKNILVEDTEKGMTLYYK